LTGVAVLRISITGARCHRFGGARLALLRVLLAALVAVQ
jgi:hypothetical protein